MRTKELMLYKHMEDGQILTDMTFLMENYDNDYYNTEDMKGLLFEQMNDILELSASHGFEGNLWHTLSYIPSGQAMKMHTVLPVRLSGAIDGSLNQVALHDFEIFKELFDYDFRKMEEAFGVDCISMIKEYAGDSSHGNVFNKRIRDRICDLAKSLAEGRRCRGFQGESNRVLQGIRRWKTGTSQSIPD